MDEYEIQGIKTTVPFFRWLLRSDAFAAGPLDTTFIDTTLAERGGRPFVEPSSEAEELAVIGAAVHVFMEAGSQDATVNVDGGSTWRRVARADALRA